MFARLKQRLRDFSKAPSGTRFQRQYRSRTVRSHPLRSLLFLVCGALLIPLGIAMLILPGPGLIAILLGACLIAGESLLAAQWLDWLDFRASAIYARWRGRQRQ